MHLTQLFFSFYPSVFDSSITQLQHSLQQISSWMTANLLTLNFSKTVFLLVSLNNLTKLILAHWLLLTLLTILVLSLMNTSLSLTKYLLSLNLAIINLSYLLTLLYSFLSWLQNCQCHRHFCHSF